MNHIDIRVVLDEFLDLLESGKGDESTNLHTLELILDQLALAHHFAENIFEAKVFDPPVQDYQRWRQLAILRFPQLGLYQVPSKMIKPILGTELLISDALDDVADIACELSEVLWRWEHTRTQDALWQFRFGYAHHWGEHLRNLQCYLYALQSEA